MPQERGRYEMVSIMAKKRCQFHVAIGGNLKFEGTTSVGVLQQCLGCFGPRDLHLIAISRFFETPCFPAGAGPDYVNAALTIQADLEPAEVLIRLHEIEAEFSRIREQRWGMRTLDLDLIASEDLAYPNVEKLKTWLNLPLEAQKQVAPDSLLLPHPRVQDRAFVLQPLCDIAPNWRHPVLGKTVREMLAALPEALRDEVKPL